MISSPVKTKLVSKVDNHNDEDPLVTFIINDKKATYKYTIRIIAFIPSEIKDDFEIKGPGNKETIKTSLGTVDIRTILIRWQLPIEPQEGPHDVWSITIGYTPENIDIEDHGICLQYEFSPRPDTVPPKPRLSRGTVVTSANPI